MKNKIITHFYVKEEKKDDNGEAPIYLRITVNGKRAEISTNRRINPCLWDKSAKRVSGRSEPIRAINTQLDTLAGKVVKYFSNLDTKDERISTDQIVAEIKGIGKDQMTLVRAYEHQISTIKPLTGIEYAETTVDKYEYALSSIKKFLKSQLNKPDIKLCELDYSFIEAYHNFLRTTVNLMHNSAVKYIRILLRIINISISNKWIISNPFKNFNCNYVNPPRSILTDEEIDALYNKEFKIKRLARVRDVFIFQIYTGLSYIDMAELTEDNIEIGIDGNRWIVVHRKKTGTRSSIPILPRAQEVLDKYKTDPSCIADHKLLPICTNQRMNGYLKEIADICEIKKPLTTHIARHTFATTITLSHGVPIETVSKMLGHTDLKTTQIYSKVVDKKIADDMQKLLNDNKNSELGIVNQAQ